MKKDVLKSIGFLIGSSILISGCTIVLPDNQEKSVVEPKPTFEPKPDYVSNPLATPPRLVNEQVNQEGSQTPPLCNNGKPADWFEGKGRFSCIGQDRDNNP